eukprot:385174-Prorocentrum_minimum.AAC.2
MPSLHRVTLAIEDRGSFERSRIAWLDIAYFQIFVNQSNSAIAFYLCSLEVVCCRAGKAKHKYALLAMIGSVSSERGVFLAQRVCYQEIGPATSLSKVAGGHVRFTSIDASADYVVLGASTGSLYVFARGTRFTSHRKLENICILAHKAKHNSGQLYAAVELVLATG